MTFNPTYSGLFMLGSALLLALFAYNRFRGLKPATEQAVNALFFGASTCMTIAFLLYALPGLVSLDASALSLCTVLATIIDMVAFDYFLCIPMTLWLSERRYTLFSHLVGAYVLLTAVVLILNPPAPVIVQSVIHWNFTSLESALVLALNVVAFGLNIIVLLELLRTSIPSSWPKLMALMGSFLLTGLGGGYLSIGDNQTILTAAYACLFVGVLLLIVGTYVFSIPDGSIME